MDKIVIDNITFDVLRVTPTINRMVTQNESMNGSLRVRFRGSRTSLNVEFDEMTKGDKEKLEAILEKQSYLVSWNSEEFHMACTDESVTFSECYYDIHGYEYYSGVTLELQTVVPNREVNSI